MSEIEDLQKELAESKGRFRSLMDNCVDAMIIIDQDGSILDFNPVSFPPKTGPLFCSR